MMMNYRNRRCSLFPLLLLLGFAAGPSLAASTQVSNYHKAVSNIQKQYKACADHYNNRHSKAKSTCTTAQSLIGKADKAFELIPKSEKDKKPVPALRGVLASYKQLIADTLAALGGGQTGNQNLALAGGSSGRLSADQLPASAYESETAQANTTLAGASSARVAATQARQRKDSAVVSFYAEDFHSETIKRGEIYDVFSFHRYIKRLQVDAFAAGDVQPGDELPYAAVCGQWIEWMLREEGINPLKIASYAWGHMDAQLAQFPWYFPSESGPSTGNAPYCVVGLTAEGIHSWSDDTLGKVAIYLSPESGAPESQVDDLAAQLTEEPERLSVEVMGHADGLGTADEITQFGQTCADSVAQALTAAGVEPTRLETRSYGNSRLGYGNATSERPWSCAVTIRDLLVLE